MNHREHRGTATEVPLWNSVTSVVKGFDFSMKRIHKVAILGAGTMGARIAAHFANAGVPSYLLDIVPPDAGPNRNKIAAAGLEAAKKSKPAAFFETFAGEPGHSRQLRRRSEKTSRRRLDHRSRSRKPGNQAGIIKESRSRPQTRHHHHHQHQRTPVAKIAEGFSDDFRRSWFGTHFFNPPRYMRLLEIIPTPETDRALIEAVDLVQRRPTWQRRGCRQRHAKLHRQPHRHIFGAERHAPDAGDGSHHRRS